MKANVFMAEAGSNLMLDEKLRHILIIKTSALGDIIHAFNALAYLRNKFPHAEIDWVVEKSHAELVEAHPAIHRVFCVDTKRWRRGFFRPSIIKEIRTFNREIRGKFYDVIFDLQGNLKSGLILRKTRGKAKVGFGSQTVSEWPNLFFTNVRYNPPPRQNIREDYLSVVQSFCGAYELFEDSGISLKLTHEQHNRIEQLMNTSCFTDPRPKFMVCPGAFWRNKQLPSETMLEFLQLVQQQTSCFFLFVWGSQSEHVGACQLHERFLKTSCVIPKLPLPVLQNVMGKMQMVIAMDSLPLHLAGTTSVPTFSLFGPSLAQKYRPFGDAHYAIQGACPYGKSFEKRCPILRTCTTGACLRELSAKEIFEEFQSWYLQEFVDESEETVLSAYPKA